MSESINANWPRWIQQSLIIHFKSKVDPYHLHIEGRRRKDPEPEPRFELRVDGPYFNQVSHNYWIIEVEINLLIMSFRDETDAYKHERLKGLGGAAFTNSIGILKYGTGNDDNASELLGCMMETSDNNSKEKIIISNFGAIEPTNQIMMSTVEGHYRMTIKN